MWRPWTVFSVEPPTTLEYLKNKTYLQSSVKVYFPEKNLNSLINKQEDQLHKVTESRTIFNTSACLWVPCR